MVYDVDSGINNLNPKALGSNIHIINVDGWAYVMILDKNNEAMAYIPLSDQVFAALYERYRSRNALAVAAE